MKLRVGSIVGALFLLSTPSLASQASATCWSCNHGEGVGWYCYSIAGEGAANCTPSWSEPCELIGTATCGTDGCQCFRYPARKVGGASHRSKQLVSQHVLILRGSNELAHNELMNHLSDRPESMSIITGPFGPDQAIAELVRRAGLSSPDQLEMSAFVAASRRGLAAVKLGSRDEVGVMIDARRGPAHPHVRFAQVSPEGRVKPLGELDSPFGEMVVSKVRIGERDYACAVWAGQSADTGDEAEAMRERHEAFIQVSEAHPALRPVGVVAEVPTLEQFQATQVGAPGSALWQVALGYYR